jgi:hypothetical protein
MKLQVLSLVLLVNFSVSCHDESKAPVADSDKPIQNKSAMPKTLNTLGSDDSGNWVLKRVWWEKAEKAFGKAMAYNSQISEQQMDYFGARNDIDKQLDEEKRRLSLSIGDISKTVSYLLGMVDDNEKLAEIDEYQEKTFKGTVLESREKLVLLQTNIALIQKLDADMDSVVAKVIDQTYKCNDYESKAWADFKQIGRVLNDEKAKELYYQVRNYRKNIKSVLEYLQQDLKISFDSLTNQAKKKIKEVQATVNELHDAGVNLAYEFKSMNEGVGETQDLDDEEDEPAPKKKKVSGIWGIVLSSLKAIWNVILWLPRKIMGFFGVKF